jgi:hypothetical protein
MNIKAILPQGLNEIIVNGLHQWDYGRKLEIHSDDLPALIEVHFACAGMTEAVVRSCAVVNGVAEAAIPDLCLEQTTPIVAWIYEVGESTGVTVQTITLPIIARARPQAGETIPTPVSDKYTELIAAVNEQVASLKKGSVTVNRALTADNARRAGSADFAELADAAETAAVLNLGGMDVCGKNQDQFTGLNANEGGYYIISFAYKSNVYCFGAIFWDGASPTYLPSVHHYLGANPMTLAGLIDARGTIAIWDTETSSRLTETGTVYIKRIANA